MKNHHRSIVISFMGVDGSGKSTLIELLRKKLKNKFKKIKYVHLRPYLILLDKSTVQANPHKTKKTWPILLNFIRILYWLIIYRLFFYLFANKPRQLIIFDRYADDLMIDPIRYKFNLPNKITKFILNFFPNPSLWIVLNAPIKELEKRKKVFSELRMTSHWPHKVRLFPKIPQTYGKKIKEISNIDMDMVSKYISEDGLKLI